LKSYKFKADDKKIKKQIKQLLNEFKEPCREIDYLNNDTKGVGYSNGYFKLNN